MATELLRFSAAVDAQKHTDSEAKCGAFMLVQLGELSSVQKAQKVLMEARNSGGIEAATSAVPRSVATQCHTLRPHLAKHNLARPHLANFFFGSVVVFGGPEGCAKGRTQLGHGWTFKNLGPQTLHT